MAWTLAFVSQRQREPDSRSYARILQADFAVMCENKRSGDGQAQASATSSPGAGAVGAIEAIEDVRLLCRRDAGARIPHRNDRT